MYCNKCGTKLEESQKFCTECGMRVEEKKEENRNSNGTATTNTKTNGIKPTAASVNTERKRVNAFSITALILGILSIGTCFLWCLSIPLGIMGIIFGLIGSKTSGKMRFDYRVLLNIIGILLSIIIIALLLLFGILFDSKKNEIIKEESFSSSYYTVTYQEDKWVKTPNSNNKLNFQLIEKDGKEAITVGSLSQLGESTLPAYNTFSTASEREKMYDAFYDLYYKDSSEINAHLTYNCSRFKSLDTTSNSYIAYFSYESDDGYYGKFYVLISQKDNVVLSFISSATTTTDEMKLHHEALSLFQKMQYKKQEQSTISTSNGFLTVEDGNWPDILSSENKNDTLAQFSRDFFVSVYGTNGNIKENAISGAWDITEESDESIYYAISCLGENFYAIQNLSSDDLHVGVLREELTDGSVSTAFSVSQKTATLSIPSTKVLRKFQVLIDSFANILPNYSIKKLKTTDFTLEDSLSPDAVYYTRTDKYSQMVVTIKSKDGKSGKRIFAIFKEDEIVGAGIAPFI